MTALVIYGVPIMASCIASRTLATKNRSMLSQLPNANQPVSVQRFLLVTSSAPRRTHSRLERAVDAQLLLLR